MAPSQPHRYDEVRTSDEKGIEVPGSEQDSENDPFLDSNRLSQSSRSRQWLPWILSALLATGLLTSLFFLQRISSDFEHYKQIRRQNEFIDPAAIPLEEVRFSGSPQFSLNGTMSHKPYDESAPWPENVRYFGEPSPELDANWNKLIEWRYFSISESEAKSIWPDTYMDYVDELKGGWTAGLDVFHTLHCVNAIRKALRPDYYNATHHNEAPHADHCLDAIRQYIQCSGFTTLIPTRFREGVKRNYIESDQVHTCRSFTYLREWTTNRMEGGPDYKERDQTVLDLRKHALAEEKAQRNAAHAEGLP